MGGEIKRDSTLNTVPNYLIRVQTTTTTETRSGSTYRGTQKEKNQLWKPKIETQQEELGQLLINPSPPLAYTKMDEQNEQAFRYKIALMQQRADEVRNNSVLYGGDPIVTTTYTDPANEKLEQTFNNASKKAIETSMRALGLEPNENLPDLLNKYSAPLESNEGNDKTLEDIAATGTSLPEILSSISPAIQDMMDAATKQAQSVLNSILDNVDLEQSATTSRWVIRENMYENTANGTQDMQELFGTEGRFESAFDLSNVAKGSSGLQTESQDGSMELASGTMLTLEEQKTLAAYALYSAPKFYIPPMLVVNDEKGFQSLSGNSAGTGDLKCFIFLSIGNLAIEDATYPRNVPILKVPDADIDAVQDLGFGSGTIKISGVLWGESGYVRLQSLRELCKTRRALIWTAQETGAWLVFPQNVPGINTNAGSPGQYYFEFTLICVGKLKEDSRVKAINKQRMLAVERKFKQETAILTNSKSGFKLMSSMANSELNLGYVWDPAIGGYTQTSIEGASLGELIPDPEIATRTFGAGSATKTDTGEESPGTTETNYEFPQYKFPIFPKDPTDTIDDTVSESEFAKNDQEFRRADLIEAARKEQEKIDKNIGFGFWDWLKRPFQAHADKEIERMRKQYEKDPNTNFLPDDLPIIVAASTPFITASSTTLPLDTNIIDKYNNYVIDYSSMFNNRGTVGLSPSELYYWIGQLEGTLEALQVCHPDLMSAELLEELNASSWTLQEYSSAYGFYTKMLCDFFGELAKRNLPARDPKSTPSIVYSEEVYAAKKLSQYYKTSTEIARRQGTMPSNSTKPARHPTTISNNVIYKKRTPKTPSLLNIKTTTNNNRWTTTKTKTLRRPDE